MRTLLEAVDLTRWANEQVKHLSAGMRRRMDAPPCGTCCPACSPNATSPSFFTTHYMDEADKLCDRVAIVDQGKLVALDTPLALKASIPGEHTTLDDVFVHYTGRQVRDARQAASPLDFGFMARQ